LEELARVKNRVRELEAYAQALPPAAPLADSIADAMGRPKPTRSERDLANAAKFYSPTEEAAFRQREKVGAEKYDAELARMGGDLLSQSIALEGRAAFVKLGGKIPDPED
jgi:hypothetical protein